MALDTDYKKILGWLKDDEAKMLYECALKCGINRVLELGSFCGKSTVCLAKAMKERDGLVIAVDYFPKNQKFWGSEIIVEDTKKEFWKNVSKAGVINNIISVQANHNDFLSKLNGKFGLIFIDGGHTFGQVMQDARYAWEHTLNGSFIIFHDYENKEWTEVKEAADIMCKKWKLKGKKVDSCLVVLKEVI